MDTLVASDVENKNGVLLCHTRRFVDMSRVANRGGATASGSAAWQVVNGF